MIDKYPSLSANWNYPTKVRFGPGRIKGAGGCLPRRAACRGPFLSPIRG